MDVQADARGASVNTIQERKSVVPHLGLAENGYARYAVYALMAFPIIDYALRLPHIHPLGVIWDKIVLVILFIVAASRYISGHRNKTFQWNRYMLWFILFGAGLMFAGMADPKIALQGYRIDIYYMLYTFLIPFLVVPKDVPKLLYILAGVATLIAVSGIYQYVTAVPIPAAWIDTSQHVRTRVFSVMQSPNELGSYMALMTPILFGFWLAESNLRRKWLFAFGTICCAATLLFTFTRGAWVALVASMFLMALFYKRRLLIVLVIVAVAGFFLPPIHHRIGELLSPVYWIKSSTGGGRISKWLTAFDKMAINPLFGVGEGNFGGAVSAEYHNGIYSDNYYAKTLAETGLVGLVLFISIHVALFRELFRTTLKRIRSKQRFIVLGAITGLLAVAIHNCIENVFEFGPMAVTYFSVGTILLIWGRSQGEEEGQYETIAENGQPL